MTRRRQWPWDGGVSKQGLTRTEGGYVCFRVEVSWSPQKLLGAGAPPAHLEAVLTPLPPTPCRTCQGGAESRTDAGADAAAGAAVQAQGERWVWHWPSCATLPWTPVGAGHVLRCLLRLPSPFMVQGSQESSRTGSGLWPEFLQQNHLEGRCGQGCPGLPRTSSHLASFAEHITNVGKTEALSPRTGCCKAQPESEHVL